MTAAKKPSQPLLEMGPLVLFFAGYYLYDLITATAVLVVATLLSVIVIYVREKRVPLMPLLSAIVVAVFGGLTVALDDELFIKLKPTIVNLIFASILLIGAVVFKRGLLSYLFSGAFQLNNDGWRILSLRWGLFFIFLAVLNEVIWRNFSTEFWVNFKVFGMLIVTLLFTISQIPLIKRYSTQPIH
ncbi:MAG: septation protein A [Rickettsiales bacterium]|nr:septation protein A [Rickettsiales bacterium]